MNQADFNKLYQTGREHRRRFSIDSETCSLAAFFELRKKYPTFGRARQGARPVPGREHPLTEVRLAALRGIFA